MGAVRFLLALLTAAPQLVLSAHAGTVAVKALDADRIVVVADHATVDEVLAHIGERFGFGVERISSEPEPKLVSGRFAGTPDAVVDHLLRGQGHVLVRQAGAPVGIERILLLGTPGTVAIASPPAGVPRMPSPPDPTNPVTTGKPSPGGSYAAGGRPGAPAAGQAPALSAEPVQPSR
jgi:hypothetical protein